MYSFFAVIHRVEVEVEMRAGEFLFVCPINDLCVLVYE